MKLQVESDYYYKKYDSKKRFCSYWHQIQEIFSLKPKKVLEIGIGNSFVSKYLRDRGLNLITLDIDRGLKPDVIGTILGAPFVDQSFDVVACYEVLEHLPYVDFPIALREIYRISRKYTVLSIPDATRVYRFDIQFPRLGELKKLIPLPRFTPPIHEFNGHHYWQIGKKGYSLRKVMDEMQSSGFEIKNTYRPFEIPYHRFFVLAKTQR